MSRSTPTLTNPAQHFIEWSGSKGQLQWYNKEKGENIPIRLPFEFLVLDQLKTIKGYSEQDKSGFWSNEVKNSTKQPLTVRTRAGIKAQGLYADIKDKIKAEGAKFSSSVYITHKVNGEWVIGNLQITGAALSPWIDFTGKHKVENGKVIVSGKTEDKKGSNTFFVPVFEYTNASTDEDSIALDLDKQLQVYLMQYFTATQAAELDEAANSVRVDQIDDSDTYATPEQIADFEKRKAQNTQLKADDYPEEDQSAYNRQAVAEVFNDEPPFTDDDLPPEFM